MDDSQPSPMGSRLSDRLRLLLDEATTAPSGESQAVDTNLNFKEVVMCHDTPSSFVILSCDFELKKKKKK